MNSYLIVNCNNLQLVNKSILPHVRYFLTILLIFYFYNDSILLDYYILCTEEKYEWWMENCSRIKKRKPKW